VRALRMAILPTGTVPVWAWYGTLLYPWVPLDSTHTLPVKSWVGDKGIANKAHYLGIPGTR
jgi:hypothetical protein